MAVRTSPFSCLPSPTSSWPGNNLFVHLVCTGLPHMTCELLLANLPCPGETTWWTGIPVYMTVVFQDHMGACAQPLTHWLYLSAATWGPGNVCLHICHATTTPCGSLGTLVRKSPVSQNCHVPAPPWGKVGTNNCTCALSQWHCMVALTRVC